jgi:hypothetical protein
MNVHLYTTFAVARARTGFDVPVVAVDPLGEIE